jgi:hypothetical protein
VGADLDACRGELREPAGVQQVERAGAERAVPLVRAAEPPGDREHQRRDPALRQKRERRVAHIHVRVVEGE